MQFLLLNNLFGHKLAQAICWTLVNSLWQGLFFALCSGITILATRKTVAVIRYNTIAILFSAFIVVAGYTFIYEWNLSASMSDSLSANNNSLFSSLLNSYGLPVYLQRFNEFLSTYATYVVFVWLVVFSIKGFQTIGALAYTYRLKTVQINSPADAWKEKLQSFAGQLQIKKNVKLLESRLTRIPVVIGHFKPIIFIPAGLLTQLPADQVEAVLWHELAHIRRNDYLVNFFQHFVEAVFFFNPGVLWISAVLRTERENCCDDIAIKKTSNKKQFIEALISFKEFALAGTDFAPAFPGKKNQLLQRVSRIVTHQNKTLHITEKIFFLLGFVLLVAFFSIGTQTSNQQIILSNQKLATEKLLIHKNTIQSEVLNDNKRESQLMQKMTTNTSTKIIEAKKDLRLGQRKAISEIYADQVRQEKPTVINNREKMEIDRKQAMDDQQRALLDQDQSKRGQAQAQFDKLMAERDAQKAAIDKQYAEQLVIKAKMDRARAYQALAPVKAKTE